MPPPPSTSWKKRSRWLGFGTVALLVALSGIRLACLPDDVPPESEPILSPSNGPNVDLVNCDTYPIDTSLLPNSAGAARHSQLARWSTYLDSLVLDGNSDLVAKLVRCKSPKLRLATGFYWVKTHPSELDTVSHLLSDDVLLPALDGKRSVANWFVVDLCEDWSIGAESLVRQSARGAYTYARPMAISCLLKKDARSGRKEALDALQSQNRAIRYHTLKLIWWDFYSGGCDPTLVNAVAMHAHDESYWVRIAAVRSLSECPSVRTRVLRAASWDQSAAVRREVAKAFAEDAPLAPDVTLRLLIDRDRETRRIVVNDTRPARSFEQAAGNPVACLKDIGQLW